MPGRDRRGPMGAGAATGRGMAYCTGTGFGRGRGMGRGFGYGLGQGYGAAAPAFYPPSEQEQEAYLTARETALEEELKRVRQARKEGKTGPE